MDGPKERLAAIVGPGNLADDEETIASYAADRSFASPMRPSFVARVHSADEVQALVRYANETRTPLVPVSSKGPRYRGDTVPGVPEAVIVDLGGMKRILNVNRQQRIAVVEPGVTYGELSKALAAEGLAISMPLAPKAGKSVVASVLDLEPRLNALHQWNFLDPLRCTEVVWGDGNRMFTGEAGGGPLDLEKQWAGEKWQVGGTGPMMLDFYRLLTGSQGSMGIVTWASLKCEVATTEHKLFIVPASRIENLLDFAYQTLRARFGEEFLIVNGATLAALLGEDAAEAGELAKVLPPWAALVGISGQAILPELRVKAQTADIGEMAQLNGLGLLPAISGIGGDTILRRISQPSGSEYWKDRPRGGFQEIFFTTTLDQSPSFIARMKSLAESAGWPSSDLGVYIQPQNMGTSVHCEFILFYNPSNQAETARARELFTLASEEFSRMGAYYLRPHGIWARLQMNKDAQSARILRQLKNVFDPECIMNAGKLGLRGI